MRYLIMAFSLVLAPLASARAQNASPFSCGAEWMSWWAPFHMLVPLLFFGLVIVGVIVLVRKLWPDEQRYGRSTRVHELLDERYAKGEIEREDYLRRRQDIRGS
jgi:putative membrane protein